MKANFQIQLNESKFDKELQISKGNAIGVANTLYQQVLDGQTSAINVAELFKFMEHVGEQIKGMADENGKNKFVDLIRGEISRLSDESGNYTSKFGTVFKQAETGVKYDYTKCGDPLWNYYNTEMEKLDKKKKKRETFLKTIAVAYPAGNVLVPETGELHENVEIKPPIKTSNSSYMQTLAD